MQESHRAARCMLDGPMQGNCPDTMVQEAGPCKDLMQGVGQLEFISNIFSFTPWANVSTLPKYYCAGSGPVQGFCIRAFRLLWANSSSSAMSAYLHCGPMRAFFPGSTPSAGPHESLIWQPGLCWMDPNIIAQEVGPCKDFA